MKDNTLTPIVQTIKEKCRVCYSCVRECPAHAIRISGGQAEVITEKCIGCGNCVRVCTQNAKVVRTSIRQVEKLLKSDSKIIAAIAPSFPAEFLDINYKKVVGMIRKLGFDYVVEVAFGADLVSLRYKEKIENDTESYIGSTCPSVVNYIEKYFPDLVENLMPVTSPMIAVGRVIHEVYGDEFEIVFIGPCLAKKDEASRTNDITEALTFKELQEMFNENSITPENCDPSHFDPPMPGKGALYPIGKGILQSAGLTEDLMSTDIIATDGTKQFVQAIKEFENSKDSVKFLELLCCNGCIMGPGMTADIAQLTRRGHVSAYVRKRYNKLNVEEWEKEMDKFDNLDLSISFQIDDQRKPSPDRNDLTSILEKMGKHGVEDELNCGACGYDTCIEHGIAIHRGLAENEMCLPYTIDILKITTEELTKSYKDLLSAKKALIQTEKLASLGRLASGIAHEINNPLTGVLAFSSLLLEDLEDSEYAEDIKTIVDETKRCRDIVKGLLDFARETKSEKEPYNINDIISEAMTILKKHVNFKDINIITDLSPEVPMFYLDKNQMRSVINNLAVNSADAMVSGGNFIIKTRYFSEDKIIKINISDTGTGMPKEILSKIFDPFFTTKKAGKGTGLGLAVIYGIIERHKGTVRVESSIGKGTEFFIEIPVD